MSSGTVPGAFTYITTFNLYNSESGIANLHPRVIDEEIEAWRGKVI